MRILLTVGCALALAPAFSAYAQTSAAPPAQTAAPAQAAQRQRDQQKLQRDQEKLRRDQLAVPRNQGVIEQDLQWLQQDQRMAEHNQRVAEQNQQSAELGQQQLEKQMQQARHAMEQAAQRMAQLSLQMQGPMLARLSHRLDPNRAVLGVSITDNSDSKHPQGVQVLAVTPGGPADQAGLRAGDTITSINGAPLRASAQQSPADQLMNFMDKIKPGDTLKLDYVRAGQDHNTTIKAGRLADYSFAFDLPPVPLAPPVPPVPPAPPVLRSENLRALFPGWWGAWGGMQLTQLTPALGQYFGTDQGLLVVRAPRDTALKLQDGDVILKIGERVPTTPSEAMRILYSYAPGETLTLHIMRKGKPLTLGISAPKTTRPGTYQPMNLSLVIHQPSR